MATTDTSKLRAELETERGDLARQLSELEKDGSAAPDFDENFADSGQVAAEHCSKPSTGTASSTISNPAH